MKNSETQPINLSNTLGWMPSNTLPCPAIGSDGEIVFHSKNTQDEQKTAIESLDRTLNLFSLKLNKPGYKQLSHEQYETLSRELVSQLFPDIKDKISQIGLFTPRETLGSFIDGAFDTAKRYFSEWVVDPSFMPRTIADRVQLNDNVSNSRRLLDLVRLINKSGYVSDEPSAVLYSRNLHHEVYSLLGLTHEAAYVELDRTFDEDLYTEFVDKTSDFIPNLTKTWTWIKISPSGEWCKAGIGLSEKEVINQIINDDEGLVGGSEQKVLIKKRKQTSDLIRKIVQRMERSENGIKSAIIDIDKMAKSTILSAEDISKLVQIYTEITAEKNDQSASDPKVLLDEIYTRFRRLKRGRYFKIDFTVRPFGPGNMDYVYFYNRPKEIESEMFKMQRERKVEDRIAATFVSHNQLTTNRFTDFLRNQFDKMGSDESNMRWIIIKETNPSINPQARRINTDKYKAIKVDFDRYLETLLDSLDKQEIGKAYFQKYMSYKGKAYQNMNMSDLMFLFQTYEGPLVEVDVHTFTAGGDKQSWLQLEYGPDLNHDAMRGRQAIESGVMEHLRPKSIYGVDWDSELENIIRYANQQALPDEYQFDIEEYLKQKVERE